MAPPQTAPLIPPRFLFRFQVPLVRCDSVWSQQDARLPDECRLPELHRIDNARTWADVRAAWSNHGIAVQVTVKDKRQPIWCRETRLDESDGLQVWIDTRPAGNAHRATRFCHRFAFLPAGGGHSYDQPVADQLLINRARENARPVRPRELQLRVARRGQGYALLALIPAASLPGFDPGESTQLGLNYAVFDRELGVQALSVLDQFPFQEDPSLWPGATLV